MDPAHREWHVKWLGSWALVVTLFASIALASYYTRRRPPLVLGVHSNVTFEQALEVLIGGDNLSQRLSAQKILYDRMHAAVAALRSPRTIDEAEASEAILRHLREEMSK